MRLRETGFDSGAEPRGERAVRLQELRVDVEPAVARIDAALELLRLSEIGKIEDDAPIDADTLSLLYHASARDAVAGTPRRARMPPPPRTRPRCRASLAPPGPKTRLGSPARAVAAPQSTPNRSPPRLKVSPRTLQQNSS